eukprot:SAG31_NODE_2156_length_6309_cov_30.741707_3_plen_120_part_00
MAAAPYHKVDDAVAVPVAVPVAAPAGAALPVVPATAVPAAGTVVSVRQGGGTTVVVQQSHGPVHVNYWGYGGGIVDQCCDDEHIFVLGFCCPCGKGGYFLVFVPPIREIRDFLSRDVTH